MDRRTILAVILIGLFLVFYYPLLHLLGLDRYVGNRGKSAPAVDTTRTSAPVAAAPTPPGVAPATAPAGTPSIRRAAVAAGELERQIRVETPLYDAVFSNRGARLVSVELKHYATAHGTSAAAGRQPPRPDRGTLSPGDRVVLAGGPTLGLDLGSGANLMPLDSLVYTVSESTGTSGVRALTFTAHDTSGLEVVQTYRTRPGDYGFDLEVEIHGVPDAWRVTEYSLTTRSWPLFTEADLLADLRSVRASSLVGTSLHRETPGSLRAPRRFEGSALWAGVHTRYFFSGVAARDGSARAVVSGAARRALTADQQRLLGGRSRADQEIAINSLVSALPGTARSRHRYLVYVGPNEYRRLVGYGLHLERSVDLGWPWIVPFSNALLTLLKWLHGVVRNYGVAIVALATLVRAVLHPLNMASMKSMRAMQRLQPEIERLREKYKNDAQAMNTAMMALYRDNKVNPAGGCLPMLVQMPVFFALYAVLFNAIELRQAPFVAWIRDLSAPDTLATVASLPIRLLPLLMLGSGLLQQRMAPTDPRQAPTMYMMNIVMLVFFYNLPSGLVLYWTVMNLLTALQQWLVLRHDDTSSAVVVETRAPARSRKR